MVSLTKGKRVCVRAGVLVYVCQNQNDDLDWSDADQFCDGSDGIGRLGNPGDSTSWATAESNIDSIANRRPR